MITWNFLFCFKGWIRNISRAYTWCARVFVCVVHWVLWASPLALIFIEPLHIFNIAEVKQMLWFRFTSVALNVILYSYITLQIDCFYTLLRLRQFLYRGNPSTIAITNNIFSYTLLLRRPQNFIQFSRLWKSKEM